ncbi:MAG: class I SAM-dependent methyltransferase [Ilumatobacteraceae bacterium]
MQLYRTVVEREGDMTDMSTVAADWDGVAAAWDAIVDEVEEHTAEPANALITRLAVQPGDRVLELAAGPGTLGATWVRLVGPTGSVVLSDVAPAMVEVARRRNAAFDNVTVDVLDASAIDRPDASAEAVACRMGLMFTPDPAAALAEIHRVLVPGGRFAALTWAALEHNPWMACVGMAAMINGIGSGPPIGPGGIFSLGDPTHLATLTTGAGFADVEVDALPVVFRSGSMDEHVARVASLAGPLARLLAAASDEQRAGVRRSAAELAAGFVTDDGVVLPGRAVLVSGVRPT